MIQVGRRGAFMTKDEARREVVRRWRALTPAERQSHQQLVAFATALDQELSFATLGDSRRVIEAWLVRDMEHRDAVLHQIDEKARHRERAPRGNR